MICENFIPLLSAEQYNENQKVPFVLSAAELLNAIKVVRHRKFRDATHCYVINSREREIK